MSWLLIFIFQGAAYAAGPYELDSCLASQAEQPPETTAVCVHVLRPWDRRKAPKSHP